MLSALTPARGLGLLALVLALCHCTTEDTGRACGNPNNLLPQQPIAGENPIAEVVRIDRDAACDSFQCLTDQGLPPYCTRSCTYDKAPAKPKSCVVDTDCTAPLHCNAGICNDDDCPAGFWCRTVQDVGPLVNQHYCVRQTNCATDFDCNNVGSITCTQMGCYDACLLTGSNCPAHLLVCTPEAQLGCNCPDNASSCTDAALVCKPPQLGQSLPAGSVTQLGVCMPK